MGNLYPPPPPQSPQMKDGKMARFGFCAPLSLNPGLGGGGGWGFAVPFYSVQDCNKNVQDCNLGQNRWEICTPIHPHQGWENGAFWLLRGFILDFFFGGGGGGIVGFLCYSATLFHVNVTPCTSSNHILGASCFGLVCRVRPLLLSLQFCLYCKNTFKLRGIFTQIPSLFHTWCLHSMSQAKSWGIMVASCTLTVDLLQLMTYFNVDSCNGCMSMTLFSHMKG